MPPPFFSGEIPYNLLVLGQNYEKLYGVWITFLSLREDLLLFVRYGMLADHLDLLRNRNSLRIYDFYFYFFYLLFYFIFLLVGG